MEDVIIIDVEISIMENRYSTHIELRVPSENEVMLREEHREESDDDEPPFGGFEEMEIDSDSEGTLSADTSQFSTPTTMSPELPICATPKKLPRKIVYGKLKPRKLNFSESGETEVETERHNGK